MGTAPTSPPPAYRGVWNSHLSPTPPKSHSALHATYRNGRSILYELRWRGEPPTTVEGPEPHRPEEEEVEDRHVPEEDALGGTGGACERGAEPGGE